VHPPTTSCVVLGRSLRAEYHGAWQNPGRSLKDRAVRVVILNLSECGPAGRRDWGHQPRRSEDRLVRDRGFRSRVWACGRSGFSRVVTQRSLPARPKASALRPDPELSPRFGALDLPRSDACVSDPQCELHDRRDQDQRQQDDEHQARARPHERASRRPSPIGTLADGSGLDSSVATATTVLARIPSSAEAERRSRASAHMP
jgi:hypothetical protein